MRTETTMFVNRVDGKCQIISGSLDCLSVEKVSFIVMALKYGKV